MEMRPTVTHTPYDTYSKEQTGNVITFAQFEEGNLLSETRNDTDIDDDSDSDLIMMRTWVFEDLQFFWGVKFPMLYRSRASECISDVYPPSIIQGRTGPP